PGGWSWAMRAGGTDEDWGNAVAAHADGSATITGRFEGTADFGGVQLQSAGGNDVFVARVCPE
ncbi:MAG: hypothetical protein RMM53_14025, partial [Bacteroidia bacterium]|nr:hypothetical protein [Bacteroidia bacterium]